MPSHLSLWEVNKMVVMHPKATSTYTYTIGITESWDKGDDDHTVE